MFSSAQTALGSVVALWRSPVKSMMGEELNAAEVTERGLLGDRAYALVDNADGKVASAKNPRKWAQLFDFRAALAGAPTIGAEIPAVRITPPDGTIVSSEQPDVHQLPSTVLDREVTLNLMVGDTVRLSITGPCPRCVLTTLPRADLPKDAGILRTAAQHNHVNVGVYAWVLRGGAVCW